MQRAFGTRCQSVGAQAAHQERHGHQKRQRQEIPTAPSLALRAWLSALRQSAVN